MIEPFRYVTNIDTSALKAQLAAHPELWGQQSARLGVGSPHAATTDIWLRYRDLEEYALRYGSDMAHFCDEHESVWLPPSDDLTEAGKIALELAGDAALGGVLITKLPPGKRIERHTDSGWHAENHLKFYVAVQNAPGARFCWDDGVINPVEGDVYEFRNEIPHWCENESPIDRISLIVCVRRETMAEAA